MLNKTRAIVLHHIKYSESSIIVTFYTEKYGRVSCMVNGIHSKKARFPITLFQPLSLLEMDFYYRSNRELQRIKDVSFACNYLTIPFNISKSTIALFLAEVLYLTLREEESNPILFAYLFHSFQLFDARDTGISNFHIWFMLHFSKYLGFFPSVKEEKRVSFSSDLLAFDALTPSAAGALNKLIYSVKGPPEELKISHHDRMALLESLIKYYTLHHEGFSRLKSYSILQEVFGQTDSV
jgi:DNA repair protein RecO (recombination protein O)